LGILPECLPGGDTGWLSQGVSNPSQSPAPDFILGWQLVCMLPQVAQRFTASQSQVKPVLPEKIWQLPVSA